MSSESIPPFDARQAQRLAREIYGLEAQAESLGGYQDRNFHLRVADREYLLKISNRSELDDLLQLQNRVLRRLDGGTGGHRFPRLMASLQGSDIGVAEAADGRSYRVRLMSWCPGIPLVRYRPQSESLLRRVGGLLGQLAVALSSIDECDTALAHEWDSVRASETLDRCRYAIGDADDRSLLESFQKRFESGTASALAHVRRGLIHNDANEYNLLVSLPALGREEDLALVDFGDLIPSVLVADPAIAAAYLLLDKADPIAAAAAVIAGYHQAFPLQEDEIVLLFDLICIRLCVSVSMSAKQRRLSSASEHHFVSEKPAWAALRSLAEVSPQWMHYRFRQACGLSACPKAVMIGDWLERHGGESAPVVEPDLAGGRNLAVLDLSVESPLLGTLEDLEETSSLSRRLFRHLEDQGATVGIGRYDEVRALYLGDLFRAPGNQRETRRTVHLGIDLFLPAGSPVFAPFDAVVHSRADNAGRLDYGPTVILRHEFPKSGISFFTLYGHLDPECLERLTPGMAIGRGERLALIGEFPVNGDWPPHLHFQIVLDMLGREGDFPGVAAPDERPVWLSLCPDPNKILRIPRRCFPRASETPDEISSQRRNHLGPSLSRSYQTPLNIVRGKGSCLYDHLGQPYLDCVNNVCHVGHCHPRVVQAIAEQASVLNTNTRYLHRNLVRYARRLSSRLPSSLEVCFFVCSGSEANDLALRLARTATQCRDVLVLDGAYHGHLSSLIEISPYKHDGPGGAGRPDFVHKLPMPDPYRSPFKNDDPQAAFLFGRETRRALELIDRRGDRPAALIVEPLLGCGGQVVPTTGALAEAFAQVKGAGGLCIADEVQVGFGRPGTHFWGFETQGLVPDIVTMGKPIGNGHPLAAVVTTREIAEAFNNGMEYFNTFGGNPVSCAAGLAVMDVIEEEGLQENALRVGGRLKQGLGELKSRHSLIGDVRGLGFFLGVELVRDHGTLEAAAAEANYLVERMRERGILLSTDGPLHNVIKIKPPMVFDEADADFLLQNLDEVLSETALNLG